MFAGEKSLKSWVKESISSPLNQVVDTNLLSTIERERERSAANKCALSILYDTISDWQPQESRTLNHIGGSIPPQIFNISTLWFIGLPGNQLSGHIPSNMGLQLTNLEKLYLGGNQLSGPFPTSISNASQLIELDRSSNYFSGSVPDTLGNLRKLKFLNLEANNLTSSGMSFISSLTNCKGLESLAFDENPLISGELPSLVGNLSGSLLGFYASQCDIRGSIPSEIGNLSSLIDIELDNNKLAGSIPASIGGLKELQSLSLEENKIQGSIPSELCHLNNLAYLNLMSNKLSGPIPACFGNLISLRNLLLGSNLFSSSIPSTLTELNYLLILDLSSNSLSGALPIDIGKWNVLTSIDFSNNQFSGDIPTGVADLEVLTHFSLSNNRITGSIPESLGDLLSLEFLDLSRNNLSGEIPKSLEKLPYLTYFNVSFNRLQGEIPEGGSFGNYSIESFKGNEGLCGAPQLHVPSCKPVRNYKARTKLIIYVTLPIAPTILVVAVLLVILRRRQIKDKLTTQEDLLRLRKWRRFSYHELHQATDGFNQSKLLEDSWIQTMTMATIGYMGPGERSLKSWVKGSRSSPLNQVVDTNLLSSIERERERSAANKCALSILQFGLECTAELPAERPDMKEVAAKLKKIKVELLRAEE
ncbi:hypothetical protein V6N13_049892 [Hibiscus sabdariffa]